MPITFKRAGQEAVALENVSFKGVALDKVTFKRAGHEAVTVFEKITQLATPQNVTANGTTVSWDAVENATSYAVLADGSEIGTIEVPTGYTLTITNNTGVKISTGDIESLNISSISPIAEIANGETKTFLIKFAEENATETYIYFYGFSFYVDNGSTYSGVGISSVDDTGGGGHPTIHFTSPVILNGSGQVTFNGYDG